MPHFIALVLGSALPRVASFYAAVTAAHVVLPAISCNGYACDWSGRVLRYRLNGPLVMICVCLSFLTLPYDAAVYAAEEHVACFAAASLVGLAASCALLAFTCHEPAFRCLTLDQKQLRKQAASDSQLALHQVQAPQRNALQHFFFGIAFNPRLLGVDLKMLCYVLGAAGLLWNLLAAAALQLRTHDTLSLALRIYLGMFAWFIFEYCCLEVVHLYTYDIFCEKLGFKITWGCFAFYPFFYGIGVWSAVHAPPTSEMPTTAVAATILLFLGGWTLTCAPISPRTHLSCP